MTTELNDAITERVIDFLCEQEDIDKSEVSLDSQFGIDLGLDSLAQVEFVMLVEDAFDIAIPDDESEKIKTVRDAVEAIQRI